MSKPKHGGMTSSSDTTPSPTSKTIPKASSAPGQANNGNDNDRNISNRENNKNKHDLDAEDMTLGCIGRTCQAISCLCGACLVVLSFGWLADG